MTPQELFDGNRKLVHYVLTRYKPREMMLLDADDAGQIALLGLWDAAKEYDPAKGEFSTFAVTIIRHRLDGEITRLSAQRRGEYATKRELSPHMRDPSPAPEEAVLREERGRLLHRQCRRVLQFLPAKVRRILRLVYVKGFSWREIAEQFGYSSEKSAQTATFGAVHRFRQQHKRMCKNAETYLPGRSYLKGRRVGKCEARDESGGGIDSSRLLRPVSAPHGVR